MIQSGVPAKLKQMVDASTIVIDSGMLDPAIVKVLAEAGKIAAAGIQHPLFVKFMKRFSEKMK